MSLSKLFFVTGAPYGYFLYWYCFVFPKAVAETLLEREGTEAIVGGF